eukprot:9073023-Alexandrium_andersonii.AAC.1
MCIRDRPKHPWISDTTLGLLRERSALASGGRYASAEAIDKQIRKQAKADRRQWFEGEFTKS